jgi:hypothetical protein
LILQPRHPLSQLVVLKWRIRLACCESERAASNASLSTLLLPYLLHPRILLIERPRHDAPLIVGASLFDSINPAAANTLAVRDPSQSITSHALDIETMARVAILPTRQRSAARETHALFLAA